MWCTARLKFDARQVAKNAIYTAFICNFRFRFTHTFLSQKLFMHFFVTKRICAHFFCREHGLRVFFAKMIYTLRPETICAFKFAIRKVWIYDHDHHPELQKRADRAIQSVLFFLAGANFWEKHAKNC